MKVLVACERFGRVRDAFLELGHDAMSCDIQPDAGGVTAFHYQQRVEPLLQYEWDLIIAFPPCTHLCVSGARWFKDKSEEQRKAVNFFMVLAKADCPRIAIENPVGIMSTRWRKPDQIIQPWQFGHGETKATCLWLKNLPKLVPTNVVDGREARVHRMPPGPDRSAERGKTYQGIAQAMAQQWGNL